MKILKNWDGLPKETIKKQKTKILLRHGAELDEAMMGSIVDKMRKGGESKRSAYKAELGMETMQEYKMGGWTSSKKKSKKRKYMTGGDTSANIYKQ